MVSHNEQENEPNLINSIEWIENLLWKSRHPVEKEICSSISVLELQKGTNVDKSLSNLFYVHGEKEVQAMRGEMLLF